MADQSLLVRIRLLLWVVILGLVLSGATAIPLETELRILGRIAEQDGTINAAEAWIIKVRDGLIDTNVKYPFIAYGTDWLAFAHFVIAIAFIGPLRDPLRNIWVIDFGIIASILILPFALIMGGLRGIPLAWRLIDCSFGLLCIPPLWYCRQLITRLERKRSTRLSR